ncbi:hypothetical protein DFR52_102511 [Hoeflea marina]|uniref:Uncharacterized protein n=1 Tax=Hoeflea marina TaxID=274592 RepID=A0A317PM75_9HYPH|nr:hypothetical protein [Hoeflea marina]PWW01847.1 hypothetical protein DFR52_102511 [Hoeflea marina]
MWDFDISRTLGIMMKTMPFIALRMAIYFGITLAYMVAIGAGSGVGYGVGHIGSDPAAFALGGGIAGFALVSLVLYWAREYILYIVKAGHIAVMVELIDNRPLPAGKGQIAHAREVVTARFGEATALFALDQLIKGAIAAVTGLIGGVAHLLPIPGLDGIARLVNGVIRMSLTYVDEIVLGYNIRTGSTNPWESSRQGVVLYAQNAKVMVRNAVWLTLIMWALSFAIFLILLAPAGALVYAMPGAASGWGFVVALVFAWALKAALLEPFAIAALMSVYFNVIENQRPDPVWDGRLMNASGKFRDLAGQAMAHVPVRSYRSGDTGPATV